MRRHALDGVSLAFGVLFALIGAAFLVGPDWVSSANLGWIVPIPLIALGLIVILVSARRGAADRRATPPSDPDVAAGPGPEGDPLDSPPSLRAD